MPEQQAPDTESASTNSLLETPVDFNHQLPAFADLLPEQAKPYWQFIQSYPIAEWLTIVAIFWLLAYVIRRYAVTLIQHLASKTTSDLDDEIIARLRAPIFSTVFWLGIIIASNSIENNASILTLVPQFALSMIVLSWLLASLNISGRLITAISRDPDRFKRLDIRAEPLLVITSKIILLVIGSYLILIIWGINPVGLIASAGIVGIAVGFAAKDTLANLFSGVFILVDRPYKLGDIINLSSGERGQVTHIGIRSTRVLTRDDIEVTIPNGVIGNEKVVNESGGSHQKMRIRLLVQCAYDADLEEVNKVLMDVAEKEEQICQFPSPRVRVRGFGASGIDIQLQCWIERPQDRGRIMHLSYMAIHKAFKEHNLEIPYPKRDLHIIKQDD